MKNNSGFTLIELILVIAILGILAVAVAPQFVNIQAQAQIAAANGQAGAIRDGANMSFAQNLAAGGAGVYPALLDTAADGACTSVAAGNPCFTNVLSTIPASGWTKAGNVYTHTGSGLSFTYTPLTGTFQ